MEPTSSSQSFFPFFLLPVELRLPVLSFVGDQKDISRLNRSCKWLRNLTMDQLYNTPVIRSTHAMSNFEQTMDAHPELRPKVYGLEFKLGMVNETWKGWRGYVSTALKPEDFPNVISLIYDTSEAAPPRQDHPVPAEELMNQVRRPFNLMVALFYDRLLHSRRDEGTKPELTDAVPFIRTCKLDFGLIHGYETWPLAHAGLLVSHRYLHDLTIVNADLLVAAHVSFEAGTTPGRPLQALTLVECEIDVHWLHRELRNVGGLKSFRAVHTNKVWNGWCSEGHKTEGQGRWCDVVKALGHHRKSLSVIELTSGTRHTVIRDLEERLDFRNFEALSTLKLDRNCIHMNESVAVEYEAVNHSALTRTVINDSQMTQ